MLTAPLEALFRSADPNQITELFVIAIVGILAIAFVLAVTRKAPRFVAYAPALLTTLGILGTFTGIFVGLLTFDTQHIDQSIPSLLGGMKTAFLTSVVGITSTIVFKVLESLLPTQRAEDVQSEVTPFHIFNEIATQTRELRELNRAIGGQAEDSLTGQIKLFRSDMNDFRSASNRNHEQFSQRLWKQLDEFATMLSKSATEQVINALKEVIVEFNDRLTEQFGDNFKRLDESVKKLVDWQANYSEQIEQMTVLYQEGVDSIDATKEAVEGIRSETARIPEDMERLSEVLLVNQHQVSELERHLEAFARVKDAAVAAVPQLQSHVDQMVEQVAMRVDKLSGAISQSADQFSETTRETNTTLRDTAREVAAGTTQVSTQIQGAMRELQTGTERVQRETATIIAEAMNGARDTVQQIAATTQSVTNEVLNSVRDSASRSTRGVEAQVEQALRKVGESISAQFASAEKEMRELLDRGFSDMGSALASVVAHIRRELDRAT